MRRFTLRTFCGFLLCAIFVAATVQLVCAQSATEGAIVGSVTDQTGASIVGANVTATNQGTSNKSAATSDSAGRYLVGHLPPGSYNLEVSAQGFGLYKHTAVIVEVGRITPIDVSLKVASAETTITTTAEAPVVETARSEFSYNVNQATMQNSPVNVRRWSTFALGTPGASADGTFGLISFRGISGLLNNNTVDGGDNNQAFFSEEKGRTRISYSISEDSIQEFQVNTSNYSAEYGRAAGGVVNAVTKSGTNSFHGQGYWFYRDSDIGATNPFATETVLVNGVNQTVPIKPPDRRHQFGGNIGGPIFKDKLFFFFNADQQLRNFPGVATASSPSTIFNPLTTGPNSEMATLNARGISAAQANAGLAFLTSLSGTVPRTGDELILFPKIDWNVTPNHHASLEYNRMRWASPQGIQTASVVFRGIDSFGSDYVKDDTMIASLASTLSPKIVNEARFNYGRDFEFENGLPSPASEPRCPTCTTYAPQVSISTGGFTFGEPNFLERPAYPDERRQQFTDTLSISHGKHIFKVGADINRVDDLLNNLFQQNGAYSYSNRVDFITDYTAYLNNPASPAKLCTTSTGTAVPCYTSFNQGFGPPAFEFPTWDLGFFFNDDWHLTSRFTLTLGLRWEYEKMPPPQVPNPALPASSVFPSDKNNFGPRVGFAWDASGNGKTVIRGGYGLYYGRIINSTISNAITNTAVISNGKALSQVPASFSNTAANAPLYPYLASLGSVTPDVVVFAPGTQNPMVHQFDIALEHEIMPNTVVSLSVLGSLGRHLPLFVDTNLNPPGTGGLPSTITYLLLNGPGAGGTPTLPLFTSRPNPNFGRITDILDGANSRYKAMVLQFNRRMTGGVQFQSSYTYAHANDLNQSSTTFTSANNVLNPLNLGLEDGRSVFDIRHRFAASIIYQPPYFRNRSTLVRYLLDGFTYSPVFAAASGAPYSGFVTGNAPGVPRSCISCFGLIGAGGTQRLPYVVRDAYQMPDTYNLDFRIAKKIWYKEFANLELMTDFFNILNHINASAINGAVGGSGTQYSAVSCSSGSATNPSACKSFAPNYSGPALSYTSNFGAITNTSSTLGGPGQRQIQIGARLTW